MGQMASTTGDPLTIGKIGRRRAPRSALLGALGLLLAGGAAPGAEPQWRVTQGDVRIAVPLRPGGGFEAKTTALSGTLTLHDLAAGRALGRARARPRGDRHGHRPAQPAPARELPGGLEGRASTRRCCRRSAWSRRTARASRARRGFAGTLAAARREPGRGRHGRDPPRGPEARVVSASFPLHAHGFRHRAAASTWASGSRTGWA